MTVKFGFLRIVIPWPDRTCDGLIIILFRTFNSHIPMERRICHSKRSNRIGLICQDCRNVSGLTDFIRSNKKSSHLTSRDRADSNRVDKGWAANSHVIISDHLTWDNLYMPAKIWISILKLLWISTPAMSHNSVSHWPMTSLFFLGAYWTSKRV